MSHPKSSTTGGSGDDLKDAMIRFIGSKIEGYAQWDMTDDNLWGCIHKEFQVFTEEQLTTIPTPYLQYLRDFLRHNGVYVIINSYIPLYKIIYNVIHEQRFEDWTHDEILEYLKTTGNFNSPSINYYLRENRIPFSTITQLHIQTNPFPQPTTPVANYGTTTPEYRTITPNPETSLTAPIPPENNQPVTEKLPQERTLTPITLSQTPTPSRTPIPSTQTLQTITPATTVLKSPLESMISPPDKPQTQALNVLKTTPKNESESTEEPGNEPRTGFNPKSGNWNVATEGKLYSNQNKYSNLMNSDQNKNCDIKPGTDARNTKKPILQSLQELLTEHRQSRQLPTRTTDTRPTTTISPEAVPDLTPSEHPGQTESTSLLSPPLNTSRNHG